MISFVHVAHAATENVSEVSGVAALGVDWHALLFQVINFFLLLVLLRIFVYPTIIRILEERRRTVEEGLKTAADMAVAKKEAAKKEAEMMKAARLKASKIVSEAQEQAGELLVQGQLLGEQHAATMKKLAAKEIDQQVRVARQALLQETATLVAKATEKIAGVTLNPKKDANLIERAIEEASAHTVH